MTWDELYALYRKYKALPRKGCIVKGSRKKSNETIEVSREEILSALDSAMSSERCFQILAARPDMTHKANFLEKLLCAIADGEDDSVSCDKCLGIFRLSWGEECPYCEVDHKNVLVVEVEK